MFDDTSYCSVCSNSFIPMISGDLSTCESCINNEILEGTRCKECYIKISQNKLGLCDECWKVYNKKQLNKEILEEKYYHSVKFNSFRIGRFRKE
jgi:hypothetical protein